MGHDTRHERDDHHDDDDDAGCFGWPRSREKYRAWMTLHTQLPTKGNPHHSKKLLGCLVLAWEKGFGLDWHVSQGLKPGFLIDSRIHA